MKNITVFLNLQELFYNPYDRGDGPMDRMPKVARFLSLNLCSKKIILKKIKIIDILKFEEDTNYIFYISLINKTIQQ